MAKGLGIFCVEGGWSQRLTATDSVLPLLHYLRGLEAIGSFAHRYVDTTEGLLDAVKRWGQKQYSHLQLGYFGFHGEPGLVRLGRKQVTLDELSDVLAGRCAGRVIYFGSCSVLGDEEGAERFLRKTKARALAGYRQEVDWFESSAFDLLLIDALTYYQRLPYAERWLVETYPDLVNRLGFVMLHAGSARSAP